MLAAIESIFFASAARTFAPGLERDAFRERWLGRYLEQCPEHFFLALSRAGQVIGYLAGCLDNPATDSRFADLPYFQNFAALCARYPAHLHINVDPDYRNAGIGGRLLAAFAAHARDAGAAGMHIVTGAASRNLRFYERNGFLQLATAPWESRTVVFMGRCLSSPQKSASPT